MIIKKINIEQVESITKKAGDGDDLEFVSKKWSEVKTEISEKSKEKPSKEDN